MAFKMKGFSPLTKEHFPELPPMGIIIDDSHLNLDMSSRNGLGLSGLGLGPHNSNSNFSTNMCNPHNLTCKLRGRVEVHTDCRGEQVLVLLYEEKSWSFMASAKQIAWRKKFAKKYGKKKKK